MNCLTENVRTLATWFSVYWNSAHVFRALARNIGNDCAIDFTRHNHKDWKHSVYKQAVLEKKNMSRRTTSCLPQARWLTNQISPLLHLSPLSVLPFRRFLIADPRHRIDRSSIYRVDAHSQKPKANTPSGDNAYLGHRLL